MISSAIIMLIVEVTIIFMLLFGFKIVQMFVNEMNEAFTCLDFVTGSNGVSVDLERDVGVFNGRKRNASKIK